ncbi:bacteriocin-like protein [Chryseobacterium hagamense]|uniref:Bacteriocin n=1 Tax=Chryseobacterium hagamense TaxID=395935 RepID=A0A511YRI6_9FLAO|nr:hypothetical protein [Chryseobacterium hagamense]GEN77806.1 hypothetical protein CHA01nite_35460 [Chryseobacterium hagamense]
MKNLRKLSKQELRSVNGGIEKCYYDPSTNTWICPCNPHTTYNCNGRCVPLDQACANPGIEL